MPSRRNADATVTIASGMLAGSSSRASTTMMFHPASRAELDGFRSKAVRSDSSGNLCGFSRDAVRCLVQPLNRLHHRLGRGGHTADAGAHLVADSALFFNGGGDGGLLFLDLTDQGHDLV